MRIEPMRWLLVLVLLWPVAGARAEAPPLSFGVFPNLSARQVVEIYRPVAQEIEKHLKRRVVIYSARDFRTFAERSAKGEYDILLTAPHLAWLAHQDAGYRPLLKYATPAHGVLVVRADTPYRTLDDLRDKTLARADVLAVSVLAVQGELAARGLRAGADYRVMDAGTHNNAVIQVVGKRADAAALGQHAYRLLPADLRDQLRVLHVTPPIASLMYLAHPRLAADEAGAIQTALKVFEASPEGQAFMARGAYGGLAPVDGGDLRTVQPYALQVKELLRNAP